MKNLKITLVILFAAIAVMSCKNSTDKNELNEPDAKVIVYYFHGEQRCATCNAVEEVTKSTIEEYFADNEDVAFVVVDFSKDENEELANKYEIAFSSLIIVSGDDVIDLTDDAFANARSNPDELEEMINDQVNKYLNN